MFVHSTLTTYRGSCCKSFSSIDNMQLFKNTAWCGDRKSRPKQRHAKRLLRRRQNAPIGDNLHAAGCSAQGTNADHLNQCQSFGQGCSNTCWRAASSHRLVATRPPWPACRDAADTADALSSVKAAVAELEACLQAAEAAAEAAQQDAQLHQQQACVALRSYPGIGPGPLLACAPQQYTSAWLLHSSALYGVTHSCSAGGQPEAACG
jgi:hypothetical protein